MNCLLQEGRRRLRLRWTSSYQSLEPFAPHLRSLYPSLAAPHLERHGLSPPIPLKQLLAKSPAPPSHPQRSNPSQLPKPKLVENCPSTCRSDIEAYDAIVSRYLFSRHPQDAQSMHLLLVKKGFEGDLFLSNNLITLYVRADDLALAHDVFDGIADKNVVSWTCLIAGYAKCGLSDEACHLFRSMLLYGTMASPFTLGSILKVCQESGTERLAFGSQLHALILKTPYALDTVVCNALISMYGGCYMHSADYARRVFDRIPIKNSISWNSIISVYSQRGDAFSSFELFSEMQRDGSELSPKPNEYTFGSLIAATYSSPSSSSSWYEPCLLDQMLVQVFKSGFSGDLYVGSSLVSAFARFGSLQTAKKIFVQMDERNTVSLNGLMVGLVKQSLGEEAVEVFKEARDLVDLNSDSYVILLSALAEFSDSEEGRRRGRELHGLVATTGLISLRVAVGNGLVNMYAKCGAIEEARTVFKLMTMRDQVSWNSMITGLDQNGIFQEALISFRDMLKTDILPANYTIISTLSSCASLKILTFGAQVHCDGIKLGLDLDVSVSNSLLKFYGVCGDVSCCWNVFRSMPKYDQISWNSMIGVLADSEASATETLHIFIDMLRAGFKPNGVTFVNILAALSPLSTLELDRQVHSLVLKHRTLEDSAVENALISCYAKSGDMEASERLFLRMSNRRDDVSWNSMIAGYIHNGLLSKSMDCVWMMMQTGENMDCFTFATVLSACASVSALDRGMEIHAFGIRSSLESDVVVDSALVDMYAKCGRIDYASRVFRFIPLKNAVSWNSMISGYARHGHGMKALELFNEMQGGNQRPDHVTFVGVLSACSHSGLVEQGFDYFQTMTTIHGLVPQMEHYSCIVDLLGRAGRIDKLEKFIQSMPMRPNSLVLRTVVVACCRSKDGARTYLGKQASEMLLELEPQNPVNHVLISYLYASQGRWDDAAGARAAMRGAPAKKETGCSWVTFRDGVHVFAAGDRSHPDKDQIYAKLHVLNQALRDAGYVPQTEFALYDVDQENKEELLSYHSEKIALAFVLTRSSGVPIRIMKNLRVCGDCHLAFKLISKIVGRQIILRDSNRYHHFADGKCSCGDYW